MTRLIPKGCRTRETTGLQAPRKFEEATFARPGGATRRSSAPDRFPAGPTAAAGTVARGPTCSRCRRAWPGRSSSRRRGDGTSRHWLRTPLTSLSDATAFAKRPDRRTAAPAEPARTTRYLAGAAKRARRCRRLGAASVDRKIAFEAQASTLRLPSQLVLRVAPQGRFPRPPGAALRRSDGRSS